MKRRHEKKMRKKLMAALIMRGNELCDQRYHLSWSICVLIARFGVEAALRYQPYRDVSMEEWRGILRRIKRWAWKSEEV